MPRSSSRSVPVVRVSQPPEETAPLSAAQVEVETDPASFARGRTYARQDHFLGRIGRGTVIAA